MGAGFCTEIAYAQKYQEKYEQHRTLSDHLKNADDVDVQLHLLIFGKHRRDVQTHSTASEKTGRLPLKSGQSLAGYALKRRLEQIEQIVGTRRRLEHDSNQGTQCRPLANKRKHGT